MVKSSINISINSTPMYIYIYKMFLVGNHVYMDDCNGNIWEYSGFQQVFLWVCKLLDMPALRRITVTPLCFLNLMLA